MKISGRGAITNNLSNRLSSLQREDDSSWLDERDGIDGPAPNLQTTVTIENPRTIMTRNKSPDIHFDRSINPYRGCEHGCIYCFARPSHAYHDLSPGKDFETRLFVKPDAVALLRNELAHPSYRPAPIAFGTNTDPFQPIEAHWKISEGCISLLAECNHPITITTKSDRVTAIVDFLAPMAAKNLVSVAISVTSLDPVIARRLEPRAAAPHRRINAIRILSDAGINVAVGIAPIIPAITDHEIEDIIEKATKAGACTAYYLPVRLPYEVAPLFKEWLQVHYPERAAKVMTIIRSIRGGRDNHPDYGIRMRGSGPWAELLRSRFLAACRKNGLTTQLPPLRLDLFRPPPHPGEQFRLFD